MIGKRGLKTGRTIVQVFFFVLVLLISLGHLLEEYAITIPLLGGVSLHAVCPFGGVVTIYQYIVSGTFVQKIHESAFILMLLVLATAVLFGPVFCGWVCPFGSVQEWMGKLGRKLFRKKFNRMISHSIDRILRYLRYAVLIWVVVVTAYSAKLFFSDYDPYFTLFNLWSDELALSGVIILAVVLLLSLVIERPFCKYACPYGAVLGITNTFRIFQIRRKAKTCINCNRCSNVCPMNIDVANKGTVRDHQCISCYVCTSDAACPVEDTVIVTTPYKDPSQEVTRED